MSSPDPRHARERDQIDLVADLKAQDDDGYGSSLLSHESCPEMVRAGALRVAGNRHAVAVVKVVAVDDDGQVHRSNPEEMT